MDDAEKQKHYELAERLLAEQNFAAAAIVGAVAVLIAAAAYSIVATPFAVGFAAAGVGVVVGLPMGFLGRGIDTKFAVLAGVYAIAGCVLGNLFRVVIEQSRVGSGSPLDALRNTPLSTLAERVAANITLVGLVYWLVAVFCAVYLAKRPLSRAERLAIGLHKLRG